MEPALPDRITVEPDNCGGTPCIRTMRVREVDLLELPASGTSHDEIPADHPYLEREDIIAALAHAAVQLNAPVRKSA